VNEPLVVILRGYAEVYVEAGTKDACSTWAGVQGAGLRVSDHLQEAFSTGEKLRLKRERLHIISPTGALQKVAQYDAYFYASLTACLNVKVEETPESALRIPAGLDRVYDRIEVKPRALRHH